MRAALVSCNRFTWYIIQVKFEICWIFVSSLLNWTSNHFVKFYCNKLKVWILLRLNCTFRLIMQISLQEKCIYRLCSQVIFFSFTFIFYILYFYILYFITWIVNILKICNFILNMYIILWKRPFYHFIWIFFDPRL